MQNTIDTLANIQLFGEDLILHLELSGGITTSFNKNVVIGMEQHFNLGGYTRMRGFDFYGIGPRIVSTLYGPMYYASNAQKYYYATAELRSPIFIPKDYNIYFSAFVDVGSAWGFPGKTTRLADGTEYVLDTWKPRVSVGGAITWNSPIMGEIGIYYAYPVKKESYDTTLNFGIKMGANFM